MYLPLIMLPASVPVEPEKTKKQKNKEKKQKLGLFF